MQTQPVPLNRFPYPLGGLLMALLLASCLRQESYTDAEAAQVMAQKLQEKVADFVANQQEQCRKTLLADATKMADSILVAEAFYKRDTTLRPHQPSKPAPPPLKEIPDTTPVKPFLPPAGKGKSAPISPKN